MNEGFWDNIAGCQPTTHRAVGSVFCPPPHQPQECRAEPPFPARVGGGSVPPPPAGGIALECSTAPVVLPRSRRFSRRFAGCSLWFAHLHCTLPVLTIVGWFYLE